MDKHGQHVITLLVITIVLLVITVELLLDKYGDLQTQNEVLRIQINKGDEHGHPSGYAIRIYERTT